MSDHKYRLKYLADKLPGDGMTKAEIQADPSLELFGATDKFILFSVIEPESGGQSINFFGVDGTREDGVMSENEMFKMGMLMMRNLATRCGLGKAREEFCWSVWNRHLAALGMPEQDLEDARDLDGHNRRQYSVEQRMKNRHETSESGG